jgi:hypothetical protein
MLKKNIYDKINQAAFDSFEGRKGRADNFEDVTSDRYDPNYYDPNYASGTQQGAGTSSTATGQPMSNIQAARPGQKLQINLVLSNPTGVKITFEIFSALNSFADVYNPTLVTGAFTMIPALSTQGLATVGVGTVGYDENGVLNIYGAAPPSATIGCGEYPYRSLVESTKTQPFRNVFLRLACQTDAQLNNNLTHFTRTFGGGYKQNTINVRSYKKPTQFQNLEVDILAPFVITGEKGLLYALEIGEVVQMGLFINRWTVTGV